MYLIDTVVLSELRKPQRNLALVSWFGRQRTADLFLSVITVAEIERGITRQRATNPDFAGALAAWLDQLLGLYAERILPFDLQTARRWDALSAALGNGSADCAFRRSRPLIPIHRDHPLRSIATSVDGDKSAVRFIC